MPEYNQFIYRETDNIRMSINLFKFTPSGHTNFQYKMEEIYDGQNDDPNNPNHRNTNTYVIEVRDWYRQGYCGTLISPFAMNIVLKEKAKSWATPLSHGERDAIKKLQNEIDMILRKDAKKAALIIDHKSYQETPERYMLNRLLSIPFFCEYYGVWPLIGYPYKRHVSDRHAEYRTSIIKLMSWSINSDIYINRDRKIIYTLHEGLDERRMDLDLKMCSEFSSEFLREDSYQWGIRHKTDSMPG